MQTDLTKLVKPLVFDGDPRWPGTAWAEGVGGSYQINEHDKDEWLLTPPKGDSSVLSTIEAAQAAANADHAARVIAALDEEAQAEVTAIIAEALRNNLDEWARGYVHRAILANLAATP